MQQTAERLFGFGAKNMKTDNITVEVTRHSLTYISEEMGVALRKSAYSPNIRERADHSCAVLDALGRTIGQAEHIPVHIGSLPLGLKNTLGYLQEKGVDLRPGDMYFLNDPYVAGTHLNDVTLVRPVFLGDQLIGYAANKAHHVDVGGVSPASIGIEATSLSQEGIVVLPTKIMEENTLLGNVVKEFALKTRMPHIVLGDLRAQVAANLLGDKRLTELVSKSDVDSFFDSCEAVLDQTHKLALAGYAKMPRGTWIGEDYLELDEELIPVRASVNLTGEGIAVDFEGTASQVNAPLNAVFGVTASAVTFAVKTIMPEDLPINDGFNRTIHVDAPRASIVNPLRPAPVAGGNLETSQRIVDTVYRALIEAMPEKIPAASHGSMNNLMMGGVLPENGQSWAFYETIGGGYGGRFGADGVNGVQVNMTNTLNTPIEVMEHYYPVTFAAYGLREGSGGAGEWRGGTGIERAFTAKASIQLTILGDRCRVRPWGAKGGSSADSSEYFVQRREGKISRMKSKDSIVLQPGDSVIVRTAGGGGYGDPQKRNPSFIQDDLENGYVTKEQARHPLHE
jgi:N-methylhydantoinase B